MKTIYLVYTPYSLYTFKTNALFSHVKADRELLYSARPMESTLADTIEWLRIQGRI